MQIIELLTPAYEAAWLPWAVQYFFLVGIATGAALLADPDGPPKPSCIRELRRPGQRYVESAILARIWASRARRRAYPKDVSRPRSNPAPPLAGWR